MRVVHLVSFLLMLAQLTQKSDADRLFANRADLASARQSAQLLKTLLKKDGAHFDAAWKLARADYWLGKHVDEHERRSYFEDGVTSAQLALKLQSTRADGHFWLAVNMAGLAELSKTAAFRWRKQIRQELEAVVAIDPAFGHGAGEIALARWYFKVPALFGGSQKAAQLHYQRALVFKPDSIAAHFYLAELRLSDGDRRKAVVELQQVIEANDDPEWNAEDQELKAKAVALLQKLTMSERR